MTFAKTAALAILAGIFTLVLSFVPSETLQIQSAQAQYYDDGYYGSYGYSNRRKYRNRRYRQRRALRKRATRKRRKKSYAKPVKPIKTRKAEGPLTAVVSLKSQTMTVFDNNGALARTRVSTGKSGHRTPTGVFSIIQKRKRHYSNLYAGAPMPFMQRITWSGIALHAGVVPSYPASHGCIRMPYSFAKKLFSMTSMGTRVIITRNGAKPAKISHAKLIRPLPPGQPENLQGDDAVAGDPPNTTKPGDQAGLSSNVEELLGVSTANAATADEVPQRTRASVAKERRLEVVRRKAKLDEAKQAFKDSAAALKAQNLAIKTVLRDLGKARQDLKRHKRAEKKAIALSKRTVRKLKRFFRKYRNAQNEDTIKRGIEQEEALEAELIQRETAAEDARRAALATEKLIADKKAELIDKRDGTKDLKAKYTALSQALTEAKKSLKDAELTLKKQNKPVHILISRKSSKLYVRQGHRDILEAEIDIDFPDAPIGTHVFTAEKFINDETDLSWTAVTAARQTAKRTKSKKKKKAPQVLVKGPAQTPENALERVAIPQEIRDKLSEFVKPGSSLIISDERKSHETGLGTDLIVLTRS